MIQMSKFYLVVVMIIVLTACEEGKTNINTELETESLIKGKLFIIGGGDRTPELMEKMIVASGMTAMDYIAVLPMSSEEPDSAYFYFDADVKAMSDMKCVYLNFEEKDVINQPKLDSLMNAKLIFITGGDQNRFMSIVKDTPIQDAITTAYDKGALIAGTSAGAAVMSKVMITGNENFSPEYSSTYDKAWKGNGIYAEGLGLIDNVILDQHFVARSRYNRLLSAMCDHIGMSGIGVDEATAILVEGKKVTVVGESQVVVFDAMDTCGVYFNHLNMRGVRMDVLTSGNVFELK